MQKTKLIHLFKALESDELREFAKFLKSPFHNNNARVIALYTYLRKYQDDLESKKLDKEVAFKKLFPKEKKYADWKMRELMSDLSLLIGQYFVWKEASRENTSQMLLIKSLNKRRTADKFFFRYAEQLEEKIGEKTLKNTDDYFQALQLNLMLYYHPSTSKYSRKGASPYLSGIAENLDLYYAMAKSRYQSEMITWEHFRGEPIHSPIPVDVLNTLSANETADIVLINIYSMINKIFREKKYELYQKAKMLTLEHLDQMSWEEANNLIILLINSASVACNSQEIHKEMWSLYKEGLDKELFLERNTFSLVQFNNIIAISCYLKKYNWTKDFIKKYYVYLPQSEDLKENIVQLYNAQMTYTQEKYADTVSLLSQIKFKDFSYGFRHYSLLIRSLYELKDDMIYDKCNSFKVYIFRKNKNKTISESVRESRYNFIRFTEELANTWVQFKPDTLSILTKIEQTERLFLRDWLIQKCKEKGSAENFNSRTSIILPNDRTV